ncbi:MAG: site-specific DNA-methyltransferase [Clostridiales bacterium]|uniref:site-specific DNA-methyltransferase n=1 Tax=Terrisporobacter sp. TaxID=1965305 RepID=UPI002A4F254E|nr:DNA methyltransferase [Terrisporobacter sp.]MDD7755899.1 site-specific DNA-methyltransferase [Clostridiales bacterium]MDY4135674.1 DNA methyltransferase [Terrisporobacter sp.]
MEIIYKKVQDLIPYINNSRTHSEEQVNQIVASINEFGFTNPILIDEKDNIIAGHGRLLASKKLKMEEVPCIVLSGLTEAQKKAYIIADNKMALNAGWDEELLKIELENLKELDFDLELTGFNVDELDDIFQAEEEQEIVEDEVPEVPEEPKAKLGDIYQLGSHRLMCGNSTSEEDVEKLMNGVKADMVFTDPPYNLETKGGCKGEIGKALRKQGNDIEFISNFEPTNFLKILPLVFDNNKLNAYIFCNKELLPTYLNWAVENKYSYNVLVWKKPNAIPIGDSHRPDIEYLLLFRKNAIWNNGLKNVNYSRCLEYSRETGLHPTMKPIKLITNEMEISSNKDNNILDLFGGSGSTLIACEQLNRKCYMMELDPHYVDVIIQRWENFTGKKAVKLNE